LPRSITWWASWPRPARLLGKLPLASPVTGLAVTAYPLREWHAGARQLALLDVDASERNRPLSAQLNRLWEAGCLLRQRFGEAVIRLAGAVSPLAPISIQVVPRWSITIRSSSPDKQFLDGGLRDVGAHMRSHIG
jgi:hypothetical protein